MEKQVIFLVHGMGDTVPGWSASIQTLIREKYNLYKISKLQKFDNLYAFKEINYNQVFEDHIETWKEKSNLVTNKLEASGIDIDVLNTLMGFVSKTSRKDFASTHVLDVILYRFMKGLKSQIISNISTQMVARLNDAPRYSIICHSLGTGVMHDVMQANLTTNEFPLSTAHGIPNVYMTLANVSRVLQDADTNVYSSAVRPRLKDKNKLYGCTRFINARHALDPFTKVRTFSPDWKKGAANPLNNLHADSFETVKISGLTGINPHDFEHYLENPACHVALFRGLAGKSAVSITELDKQQALHKQKTVAGQFGQVKTAIEAIQLNEQSSLNEAVLAWSAFQTLIKGMLPQ